MKRAVLVLAGVLGLAILLRLTLGERREAPPPPSDVEIESTELRRRQAPRAPSVARLPSRRGEERRLNGTGDDATTTAPERRSRREITGYLVDDFRSWTSIPPGYKANNVRVAGGGITVEVPTDPEQVHSGTLLSPPLPLRPPPGGRPDYPGRELPAGSSVEMEIRLSRDGTEWSDWNMVERYTAPDGPLAPLPPQSDPAALEAYQDSTTTGPTIQYRLSLTVGSQGAPLLRDLRVWHEGPARLEEDLSLHSPLEEYPL